ncbi:alpha-2,8-polysialyltransferase family protein [Streptomyces albireticuli]|uniref:alpha-2,8-polysialyltransferase family protein n=1 Tax=Streptomyces albireticuli TaxID=1940 RepID=UPI001E5538B3|nr:alpha-2,8-polysialyltransferase family protein [Streptomyces albireticuli]MCD9142776.1 alpha-2,8-polysialyltransferase family protein [Streptomyces albireticuli]MCD9162905.1 alpha-2,8-polysialyltransferase family protein [Streptomyces albireticuli]MCD9192465.1 alpha-2,8-polysialyltransferase family protein [Streptomyces albireticuli]
MTGDGTPMAGDGTRTQIFLASTLYGAATLAAALDTGCFSPADRRLLLVANTAAVPETTPALDEAPGFAPLRTRFDEVLSWNETIRPFHPSGWSPRPDDAPLWERHLRLLWGLGAGPVELIVESLQVSPAHAVALCFPDAPLEVYADGLMSYGPTRNKLDPLVGTRVRRLLHLDLVPGLRPLLLSEFGVPAELVPTEAFTKVLAELADATPPVTAPEGAALLLGQYLSALDILTPEEEERLHVRMLRGAVARGHRALVFKPHPAAPARWSRALEEEAGRLGADLTVLDTPMLAEVVYQRIRPALVVGCFSTALLTARAFYGLRVARTGTDLLLERLSPYQNSNRVPVTLVDALLPGLEDGGVDGGVDGDADDGTGGRAVGQADDRATGAAAGKAADADGDRGVSAAGGEVTDVAGESEARGPAGEELAGLLAAVGFAMQPQVLPSLRPTAERYLAAHLDERTRRYFKRRRLTALALPGALPAPLAFLPRNPAVRKVARRARAVRRRLAGSAGKQSKQSKQGQQPVKPTAPAKPKVTT